LEASGAAPPDLYVVSAGNQFEIPAAPMRGRLYLNDGHGRFTRDVDAIPELYENGGCVAAGDFDGDGHVDLFLGSRSVPARYGASPKSHLLRNDGRGRFVDVTMERAPGLSDAGMITSAAWLDYDGDRRLDLVVVGEWTPVRVFRQEQGKLVERTKQVGLERSEGWWNSVTVTDVNGDARPDLVLGNLGLNSYITASREAPARLYLGDFAHDGKLTPILTLSRDDGDHPVAGRDELARAIPALRSRFPTYASFGGKTIDRIVPEADLRAARTLVAHTFESAIALSDGRGRFTLQPLPVEAQLAPVRAVVAEDFDRDGRTDLLVGGNVFGVPPIQGRYDASYGLLLRGRPDGRFEAVDMTQSGVELTGQVRRMRSLRTAAGRLVAVARNADRLLLLSSRAQSRDLHVQSSRAQSRDLHPRTTPR
jgi:enediyne biosynthesis protein E4